MGTIGLSELNMIISLGANGPSLGTSGMLQGAIMISNTVSVGASGAASSVLPQPTSKDITGALERIFESLGRFVSARPEQIIVLFLFVLHCQLESPRFRLRIGATLETSTDRMEIPRNFETWIRYQNLEPRNEKLWVPTSTESLRNHMFVTKHFPPWPNAQSLYLEALDGSDVLTPEAFDKAESIHNQILSLTWEDARHQLKEGNGTMADTSLSSRETFQTLCLSFVGSKGATNVLDCSMHNPLAVLGYNSGAWVDRDDLLETLNDPQEWDRGHLGPRLVLEGVLGGIKTALHTRSIVKAQALSLSYLLATNKTLLMQQKHDPSINGWEQAFLELMEEQQRDGSPWRVTYRVGNSFQNELERSLVNDLGVLNIASVCIIAYTYLAISRPRDGAVGSRLLLTLSGTLNVGLAVLASCGVGGYMGIVSSPLMQIFPFIILSVGVDGMFVLQSALDATSTDDCMEVRMGEAVRDGGMSVAISSCINFFAFMIGTSSCLPALSAFCSYAAIGILLNVLLQITFFAACMTLDKQRQEARMSDITMYPIPNSPKDAGYLCGLIGAPFDEGYRVAAMQWLAKQYMNQAVKCAVLLVYCVLLAIGILGAARVKVDTDVSRFIPKDSYLHDWMKVSAEKFGVSGTDSSLYWVHDTKDGVVNFSDPNVQAQMDQSLEQLRQNPFVIPGSVSSWWEEMQALNETSPGDTFNTTLKQFLGSTAGARYSRDIVFVEDDFEKGILAARSSFMWKSTRDTQQQIQAMDSLRSIENVIPEPLGSKTFVHSPDFLLIEQYKSLRGQAVRNVLYGFLVIVVVVLMLVANLQAAALALLCVGSAILELIGLMYIRGLHMDSVAVISVVISLGLAVDYSVHIAHAYLAVHDPDPGTRLRKTLAKTGVAVLNGATSTLVAALCLAGCTSYIFLTFCTALMFIVVLGVFQGLVVLPVLLDIYRPTSHEEVQPEKDDLEPLKWSYGYTRVGLAPNEMF